MSYIELQKKKKMSFSQQKRHFQVMGEIHKFVVTWITYLFRTNAFLKKALLFLLKEYFR